jgi:hypothetical protein
MGHVAAFSLWSYLLVRSGPVRGGSLRFRRVTVLAFCLLAGSATEGIQWATGGDASLGDLLRDIVGGAVTLGWFAPPADARNGSPSRIASVLAGILLLAASLPLCAALMDEALARRQFPVLSDFETPFETSRWGGSARISADRSVARNGKTSLRVDMDTSLYSGLFLEYFPRDWRGFRFLVAEVLNPSPKDIRITCRIHDRRHDEGEQRFEDRYNHAYNIPPGWSELRIDLRDVARAPAGRAMDLGQIRAVGLFATALQENRTLYIDFVRLE